MVARSEAGSRTWRALSRRPPRTSFSFRSLRQLVVASPHLWCFYDFFLIHADFGFPIQKFRCQGQQATHSIESSSRSDAPGVAFGAIRHDVWKLYTLHSTLLSSTVGTFCFPTALRRLYDKTTLQISTVGFLCFRRFYDGSTELYGWC